MTVTNEKELDQLVERVAKAQAQYANFSQEQVDVIFRAAALAALAKPACEKNIPQIERIQQQGELIVATTVYIDVQGKESFEYDLVTAFAKEIGVSVRFVFLKDISHLLADTKHAKVHMAAAGLTDTLKRRQTLRFSRPYQSTTEKLVYRRGDQRPKSLADIPIQTLQIVADAGYAETLENARKQHPKLSWHSVADTDVDSLLQSVDRGDTRYTVANANDFAIAEQKYYYLRAAFDFGEEKKLAWAFPLPGDDSLLVAANHFLEKAEKSGLLKRLIERYYGHTERLNFVDKRAFRRHMRERLPKYRTFFEEVAQNTSLDWQLLAAIGYQESHWRADAISPTGVGGIMMLTLDTAQQVKIKDRMDAQQSIVGSARYLRILAKKIPQRIQDPDHLWFTLASYNVGYGHLEDARILTARQGGNPDLWVEVKTRLPLLSEREYYADLKYGYARGQEPVAYVENIRNYYDLLVWYSKNPDALYQE